MENNLQNYLTEEEKKKMDEILSRAMRRREESEDKEDSILPCGFVCLNCHCQEETEQEKIHHMLVEMCRYCREFGCCVKEDEDLPF